MRLAGPAEQYEKMVAEFSQNLGVAFQILNDLKDWDGDSDNKLVAGQDVLAGRPTLLLALALEGSAPADREELLALLLHKDDRAGAGDPETVARVAPAVREGAGVRQGREAGREVSRPRRGRRRRGRADRAARTALLPGRYRPRPPKYRRPPEADVQLASLVHA